MAETRILGQDLEVSAVGLGCMGFTHAYGLPADKDESIKAIREYVTLNDGNKIAAVGFGVFMIPNDL